MYYMYILVFLKFFARTFLSASSTQTAENCRKESAEDGRHVRSAAHVVVQCFGQREHRMNAYKNSLVLNMLPVMDINDKADDDRRGVKRKVALSRSVTVV